MCHRFNQKVNLKVVAEMFSVPEVTVEFSVQKDLFPLADIPVVRLDDGGEREIALCRWGLLPFWWKPSAKHKSPASFQRMTFNARGETIHEKPTFRAAFKSRRCLIPWTGFFEHGQYFAVNDAELSAFAGLWESWRCPETGEPLESCTIVTTKANELIEQFHPRKRMPVILEDHDSRARWLSPDVVERPPLEELLRPFPAERMRHWPAGDGDGRLFS